MPPQLTRDLFSAPTPSGVGRQSVLSTATTTPSQRRAAHMSDQARRRVDAATRNLAGGRCIIENVDKDSGVQYAHCLARATPDEMVDCLEFSWNMKYRTLNLDTRENIFMLSATLHILFDKDDWLLLPDERIINQYYTAAQATLPGYSDTVAPETGRAAFPTIKNGEYHYKLIAHRIMCRVPIHRQKSSSGNNQLSANDFDFLDFPFSNHQFTSHLHPRFAICNAGEKLKKASYGFLALRNIYPHETHLLDKVAAIYEAWTERVKNTEALSDFKDSEDFGGAGDMMSESTASSRQTKKRRLNDRKRRSPGEWSGLPTQQHGQMQGQQANRVTAWQLDEATVCELDVLKEGRNSEHGMKIMEWAHHVAESSGKVDQGGLRGTIMESSAGMV